MLGVRRAMASLGADAWLITHLPNIAYLCGFSGSAGVLLVESARVTLFTDGRYKIQAAQEVTGARVRIVRPSALAAASEQLRGRAKRIVGFDPSQLTVAQKKQLDRSAGPRVRWLPRAGVVEQLRAVKDATEITLMRAAALLAGEVFGEVVALIKPGVLESDLAAEIDYRLRRKGASGVAFETIVASGRRSAWPHARPSAKAVRKNELVVLDLGAILRGYCSDLTRTIFVGRAPARIRGWYVAVVEAQQAARDALRPGALAGAADAAVRKVLKGFGLERHFVHSTGHGLGMEVHEGPRLGLGSASILQAGNVVTLEPGVYIEGTGGIRIEDDVHILPQGTELLTQVTQEFIEI
jgi:Xaa-Pro aminopeptidase